jgi:hypothetical protein
MPPNPLPVTLTISKINSLLLENISKSHTESFNFVKLCLFVNPSIRFFIFNFLVYKTEYFFKKCVYKKCQNVEY